MSIPGLAHEAIRDLVGRVRRRYAPCTGSPATHGLTRMAVQSGIETPTAEDLIRLDRQRKGKTLSNADRQSPTAPDTRIAKLKDGHLHLAYKPEPTVDLSSGAVIAAEMHPPTRATADHAGHVGQGGRASCGGRGCANARGSRRTGRRQRLSFPCWAQVARATVLGRVALPCPRRDESLRCKQEPP